MNAKPSFPAGGCWPGLTVSSLHTCGAGNVSFSGCVAPRRSPVIDSPRGSWGERVVSNPGPLPSTPRVLCPLPSWGH